MQAFRCLLQPAASLGLSADAVSESSKGAVARLRAHVVAVCAEVQSHAGYLRKVCAAKKGQLKGPSTTRTFQALLRGALPAVFTTHKRQVIEAQPSTYAGSRRRRLRCAVCLVMQPSFGCHCWDHSVEQFMFSGVV